MLSRTTAADRVHALRRSVLADRDTETVPLSALSGRTLAADVVAETDQPPRSHATMDGFAFDARDDYPLRLRDVSVYPEDDPPELATGDAVRIATGAPLPEGANAVLKREEATVRSEENGTEQLSGPPLEPWTYVYRRGSNVAGGETLFSAGERLSAKDAILLRDLGHEAVEVHERFSVALLATGTEIHEGRHTDLDSPMLAALVRSWGHDATYEGSVPDEYGVVRDRVADLADEYDVVVTTGGTSVGKKDYAVRTLSDLGSVLFHRVRIRPGKPIAVARLPDHDAVAFAIPGKPVGAHTIATLVARPFFTGDRPLPSTPATLARGFGIGAEGFDYVVPVTLTSDDGDDDGTGGTVEAFPLGHVDSPLTVYDETFDPSVLSSSTRATRADGFVVTDSGLDAGTSVDVVPYDAVER
ncbi:molybdopterin molybdotransferase MoeA [Salinigranum marinum]|uniref:molybdopterin molybdotransferase MoeA n=1 Tax=Salinigranum marinum TaxID=1515595 RepID=UPI003CCE42DB